MKIEVQDTALPRKLVFMSDLCIQEVNVFDRIPQYSLPKTIEVFLRSFERSSQDR